MSEDLKMIRRSGMTDVGVNPEGAYQIGVTLL